MSGRKIDSPLPPAAAEPKKGTRPAPPLPPRFSVSEGAEQHVGFWLVVLGIIGFLALVAVVGFGPR